MHLKENGDSSPGTAKVIFRQEKQYMTIFYKCSGKERHALSSQAVFGCGLIDWRCCCRLVQRGAVVMMGIKAVENFDTSFELQPSVSVQN